MIAHCLFEQSGTFKNEFKKLGFDAYDYDIQNEFGETDYVVDLFSEIDSAYEGGASIFDNMTSDDVIMSFFPCVRFEAIIQMQFAGNSSTQKNWSDRRKLEHVMRLHDELCIFYRTWSRMFVVAIDKGLKMIVENPATQPHYMKLYFPIKPSMIDADRSMNGDYYKKPTQYWFINFDPQTNMLLEPDEFRPVWNIKRMTSKDGVDAQTMRSMIHPTYARKFIYNNVLTKEQAKEARCYTQKAEQSRRSSTSARPS